MMKMLREAINIKIGSIHIQTFNLCFITNHLKVTFTNTLKNF